MMKPYFLYYIYRRFFQENNTAKLNFCDGAGFYPEFRDPEAKVYGTAETKKRRFEINPAFFDCISLITAAHPR